MLISWHIGAGQDILDKKKQQHCFNEKSLKKGEKGIFKFMTEQGIVSHLDISNVDIIYKFRLFVKIEEQWKSQFGL